MTWTPDSPPPCPLCGTVLAARAEPDGGEEGGMLYAYLCPVCRWEDAGSYDYQRLTVAAAPWTRGVWAELVLAREERDASRALVARFDDLIGACWRAMGGLPPPRGIVEAVAQLVEERDTLASEVTRLRVLGPDTAARVTVEARAIAADMLRPITDTWRLMVDARTAERDTLAARVRELEAPGECQSVHKLRAALAEVLDHFTQAGHPGRDCLGTGWVPVEQVEQWRSLLSPSWREGQGRNDGEE